MPRERKNILSSDVPEDLAVRARAAARASGLTVSMLIRRGLEELLARR